MWGCGVMAGRVGLFRLRYAFSFALCRVLHVHFGVKVLTYVLFLGWFICCHVLTVLQLCEFLPLIVRYFGVLCFCAL